MSGKKKTTEAKAPKKTEAKPPPGPEPSGPASSAEEAARRAMLEAMDQVVGVTQEALQPLVSALVFVGETINHAVESRTQGVRLAVVEPDEPPAALQLGPVRKSLRALAASLDDRCNRAPNPQAAEAWREAAAQVRLLANPLKKKKPEA